jgi:hypothetical protein
VFYSASGLLHAALFSNGRKGKQAAQWADGEVSLIFQAQQNHGLSDHARGAIQDEMRLYWLAVNPGIFHNFDRRVCFQLDNRQQRLKPANTS